jgi:hypothetical protein
MSRRGTRASGWGAAITMSRVCVRIIVAALTVGCATTSVSTENTGSTPAQLRRLVEHAGSVRVIVTLVEEGGTPASADTIRSTQERLLAALRTTQHSIVHRYGAAPILALDVGRDAMEVLLSSPLVASITPDAPRRPTSQ